MILITCRWRGFIKGTCDCTIVIQLSVNSKNSTIGDSEVNIQPSTLGITFMLDAHILHFLVGSKEVKSWVIEFASHHLHLRFLVNCWSCLTLTILKIQFFCNGLNLSLALPILYLPCAQKNSKCRHWTLKFFKKFKKQLRAGQTQTQKHDTRQLD